MVDLLLGEHDIAKNIIKSLLTINTLNIVADSEADKMEYRLSGKVGNIDLFNSALEFLGIKELPNLTWVIRSDGALL